MRCLWLLTFFGLVAGSAAATGAPAPREKETSAEKVEETVKFNAFGVPAETVTVIENQDAVRPNSGHLFPDCQASALEDQVRKRIISFQGETKAENTYERRARRLAEKNIGSFTQVDLEKFSPADNYLIADRLITLKINRKLTDHDFRLCVGSNPLTSRQLYLLMYPALGEEGVSVDVLNFQNAGHPLTFQYREP